MKYICLIFLLLFSGIVFADGGYSAQTGTGFFISSNGYAITNWHIVGKSADEDITAYVNHQPYNVHVIYSSSSNDIALIKVDIDGVRSLPYSFEDPGYGEKMCTSGYPHSNPPYQNPTTVCGSVSDRWYKDYINTTIHSIPGMSGSPLVDSFGQAIGVISNSDNVYYSSFATRVSHLSYIINQYRSEFTYNPTKTIKESVFMLFVYLG